MRQGSGGFRFVLAMLAIIVSGAATLLGMKLGYGLLVPSVIAGFSIFLVFLSIMLTPTVKSRRSGTRLRPADSGIQGYVAAPTDVYPGYCWQCGRRVKPDSVLCLRCGATQMHRFAPDPAPDTESAPWEVAAPRISGGTTRWDPATGTPQPWGPPPTFGNAPPPPQPQPQPQQWGSPASGAPPAAGPRRAGGRPPEQAAPRPSRPPAQPAERVAPRYRPGAPPPYLQPRQPAPAEPARRRRRR